MLSETSQLISLTREVSLLTARTGYSPLSRSVPSILFLPFLGGRGVKDQFPRTIDSLCVYCSGWGGDLFFGDSPLCFSGRLLHILPVSPWLMMVQVLGRCPRSFVGFKDT